MTGLLNFCPLLMKGYSAMFVDKDSEIRVSELNSENDLQLPSWSQEAGIAGEHIVHSHSRIPYEISLISGIFSINWITNGVYTVW